MKPMRMGTLAARDESPKSVQQRVMIFFISSFGDGLGESKISEEVSKRGFVESVKEAGGHKATASRFEGFHLFAWDGDIGRVEASDDNAIGVFV